MARMFRTALPLVAVVLLLSGSPALAGGGGKGGVCYQDAPALDQGWVAVIDSCFAPKATEARTGQVVRWQMEGYAPHTVTFMGTDVGSGALEKGASYAVRFGAPGTYTYSCLIHPDMDGRVEVSGDEVSGPPVVEVGEERTAEIDLSDAAAAANATDPRDTVLVSFDAGAGLTLVLFGLAVGAGAALVARIRRPTPRDDAARS